MTNTLNETAGISDQRTDKETSEKKISPHVATLIAKGLIAGVGFDLNLYRVEIELDGRNYWKVDFILKERYRHFNVRCATVYVNSDTGEVEENGYFDCNTPPVMENATQSMRYSLPDGSIGIRIDWDPAPTYMRNDIKPEEWEALFWDELGAADPNYAPGWRQIFSDSIPDYPALSKILGEYGSKVTFKENELEALIKECEQIAQSAKNPIALGVVKRILAACDLAKKKNASVSFVGD
jgi:hypothetical protein